MFYDYVTSRTCTWRIFNQFFLRKNEKLVIPNNFSPKGERVLQCIVLGRNPDKGYQAEMKFYGKSPSKYIITATLT